MNIAGAQENDNYAILCEWNSQESMNNQVNEGLWAYLWENFLIFLCILMWLNFVFPSDSEWALVIIFFSDMKLILLERTFNECSWISHYVIEP